LKLRIVDGADRILASADLPDGDPSSGTLDDFLGAGPPVDASGHRVVHGGRRYRTSVVIDDRVVAELDRLAELAPLHNPPAVRAIEAVRKLLPDLPTVACFDTAFHAGIPAEAAVYGIPWQWTEELGVRRFGFHGLSHAYAARRAAELLGSELGELRLVTCHLGAGASLAAVARGRSVDTTMGFTPLEGLIMATRSGSVDPGAVLWLQERLGLSPAEMTERLERSAGMLGMTGISGDMRRVLEAAGGGERRAQLALAAYAHRARAGIAAMAAAMGGVDAVVLTGGVGEGSPRVRALVCAGLEFLGVELDPDRNAAATDHDATIARHGAAVEVFRIRAREDLEIAAEVRRLLAR
jgi:acetate kinase